MLRIHFLLRQPKQKGIKAIYATVRYQGQTAILFPGWSIHTDDWINRKGINKPRDIPENNNLKDNLYQFEKLIRDTFYELKKEYTTRMNHYLDELRLRTMQYNIDFVSVDINKDYDQILQSYLIKREKMRI